MKLIVKFFGLVSVLVSPSCCKLRHSEESMSSSLNSSALYTPTSMTTVKGTHYQFIEGIWTGTGEHLYSQAAFTRALTIKRGS